MSGIKVEFAVQMGGAKCAEKVQNNLKDCGQVDIDTTLGRVVVHTELPWFHVQQKIEETGKRAVLTGFGGQSAVAMIDKGTDAAVKGVVRFTAVGEAAGCVVDGVIDGLSPGLHGIHVHECGDISDGCNSLGDHYNPRDSPHGSPSDPPHLRHAGDLGNIRADDDGRATFRFIDQNLQVSDIIGRSVSVSEKEDDYGRGTEVRSTLDGNCGSRLACGIIARAAGILQNYKRICACDGVTIWDERDVPVAGGTRKLYETKL